LWSALFKNLFITGITAKNTEIRKIYSNIL